MPARALASILRVPRPLPRAWNNELSDPGRLRRLAGTLGATGVMALFSLASGVLLARWLGPQGRGELALLLLWPQLFSTLGNVGIDLATTHFSADAGRSRHVPATVLRLALVQGTLVGGLYLAATPVLFRDADLGSLPMLMAVLIPVDLVGLYSCCALQGRLDFRAFNLARASMAPAYALGIGLLAAEGVLSVKLAAFAFLGANAFLSASALGLLARRHGLGRADAALLRTSLGYGLRGHLGRLSPQNIGFDLVIVSVLLSPHDLGLFAAAVAFLAPSRLVTSSVGLVLFPSASNAHFRGERLDARAVFLATVAVAIAAAAAMAVAAEPLIVALLGNDFRPAADVCRVLMLGEVARSAYLLLLELLRGQGRPVVTSVAEVGNWLSFSAGALAGTAVGGLIGTASGVAAASFASLALLLALAGRVQRGEAVPGPSQATLGADA